MRTTRFKSFDQVELAVHRLGEGPPVILLHGFLSSAEGNWFKPGLAEALVEAGMEVVAPDLRGHGHSQSPIDPDAWPADVLALDQLAMVEQLGLRDYALAGYSLGARTAVRAIARGLRPTRLVLGGMGDEGIMHAGPRAEMFEDAIRHGPTSRDPRVARHIANIMDAGGLNPVAMLGLLSSFHPTTEAEIAAIEAPALVICGEDDHDNGSPRRLAELLANGALRMVPGDHAAAVVTPQLRAAMVGFVAG